MAVGEMTARKKPAVVPTAGQRIGELASEGRGQEINARHGRRGGSQIFLKQNIC